MSSDTTTGIHLGINTPSATLKRTRSVGSYQRKFNGQRLPQLPQIHSDLLLQAYTHKSLRRPNAAPADYGDNERLACLGKSVFDLTITSILFQRRPFLKEADIAKCRETLLAGSMIDDWITFYNFRNKVVCHPSVAGSLKSPQEMNPVFYAYLGGICLTSGLHAVNMWVNGLVEQELEALFKELEFESETQARISSPPPKRPKSAPQETDPRIFCASEPPPSPPPVRQPPQSTLPIRPPPQSTLPIRQPPPHLNRPTGSGLPPNPMAPAQPNLPFLPMFKQAALQRGVKVDYLAEFNVPSYAGKWMVKCIVNGICKGEGHGVTKHVAKEEAARKAYYSMGWT